MLDKSRSRSYEDAAFIAAARTALPWYIGEVNQLRAENQRLREALKELAYSPVAFTDDRISYVEMQVDKDVLETAKKALEVCADG